MTRFDVGRGRPSDFQSIYTAFATPQATLWSIHDPANVRGVKDLLGHASFDTTEEYYIMGQSRLAGRALARAIGKVGRGPAVS